MKYQNYLKGWYGVILFDKRKEAIDCYNLLDSLWNKSELYNEHDIDAYYALAIEKSIGMEEEVSKEVLNDDFIKYFIFAANDEGIVQYKARNLKIVNNNYAVMPC